MKRALVVLLSLGLIAAFSMSAMAVDVKFSGEFYAAGLYLDQTTLVKNTAGTNWMYYVPKTPTISTWLSPPVGYRENMSTAFYYQRLRLKTDFIVAPGLVLSTRCDVMERAWGAARSAPGTTLDLASAGTPAENENIAFDWAYVSFISPIGLFQVGYQEDQAWGTVFGNTSLPVAKILYAIPIGNLVLGLGTGKNTGGENSITAKNPSINATDRDSSWYDFFGSYKGKNWEAGSLFRFQNVRNSRGALDPVLGLMPLGNKMWLFTSLPYFKAQFGPVSLQGEVVYTYGQLQWEDDSLMTRLAFGIFDPNITVSIMNAWLDGTVDFGMAYVGASIAYVAGDDPGTAGRMEGNGNGGVDWNPCLIMFNSNLSYWTGNITGYTTFPSALSGSNMTASLNGPMQNAWFFQLRGGVRPIDKLDIMASVSFANADKKPTPAWQYNDYGWEADLTATYKITNNLSYMLGAGYFFTGKYFRGDFGNNLANPFNPMGMEPQLANDYLIINKLTLTF